MTARANNKQFATLLRDTEFTSVFWARVVKSDGCWLWTGPKDRRGYGRVHKRLGGVQATTGAHRIAFALGHNVDLPETLVLHHCDVPACCRPDHLFVGTHTDNANDMFDKGRGGLGDQHGSRRHPESVSRGENHWASKLTADVVREIRKRVANGELQKDVAASLNLTKQRVNAIVNRKYWAHIE